MTEVNSDFLRASRESSSPYDERAQISALFNSLATFSYRAMTGDYFGVDSNGYEYFTSRQERKELVKTGNSIAKYARKNNIGTVCFMDRSARPAYIALKECWKVLYPDEKGPTVTFINPKGCISLQDVEVGRYTLRWLEEEDSCKQGCVEDTMSIRSEEEIVNEIKEIMANSENGNNPVLLFDTCLHTGTTMGTVADKLLRAGVTDLHTGAVTSYDYDGDLPIDMFVMRRAPTGGCYPFDRDEIVFKTYESVISSANDDASTRYDSMALRKEIRRAVREELGA